MPHQHSPRFLQIVDDAKKRIPELSVDEVKEKLDKREKFLLIDVREESEWAKGHLRGPFTLAKELLNVISRSVYRT